MSSQRRIDSSRASNSIRHGMLAATVVLEGEPATPTECTLVETMAARWMHRCAWGFVKAEFDLEMARNGYAIPHATQFNWALARLMEHQTKRHNSIPWPEVTSNLANATWEVDSPECVLQDEPSPISEQQKESEMEAA